MLPTRFAASLLLIAAAAPAQGQAVETPAAAGQSIQPRTAPPPDAEPDDIIVEGYRERKEYDTRTGVPIGSSAALNRTKYAYSERLAKCAARSKLSNLSRLRAVVDGEVNSARHHFAQDRLSRIYVTCGESPALLSFTSPPVTAAELTPNVADVFNGRSTVGSGVTGVVEAAPLGWSIYDRGAFTIEALKHYAPDLKLTKAETGDPAVQRRFNLREVPRNRLRFPLDYRYFEVATCMVRVEPRLAVRLAMSEGPARLGDVQEALIDRARVCVGDAKSVRVDPTQFRLYIADAVYRWAVAARNVASLIPTDRELAAVD